MADIIGTSSTDNSISGTVQFDGTSAGGTAKLYWRLFGGGWSLWSTYSSTSSFYIGGLSSSTHYQVSVDSYTAAGAVTYGPFVDIYTTAPAGPPPDTTPPTISQTYNPQATSITCSWSITDTAPTNAIQSGFNRAYMFVGGANSYSPRTQILTTYAAQSNFSCTTDGIGAAIQPNTTYTFHWEAYDNAGNWAVTSPFSVTTLASRPANWDWETPKIANQNFYLNAVEWNHFTDRINQFRTYKGLATYSFTTAPYDASRKVYGWMYNQAVTAMSPMVTLPAATAATKTTGDIITAVYFQDLRNYLNLI